VDRREVRLRGDALLAQLRHDAVSVGPLRDLDDVDEPRPLVVGVVREGELHAVDLAQKLGVVRGDLGTELQDAVELLELRKPERGRDVVEAVVVAEA
jgi:hypothetical protein